jgi:glycosyltransferase involved in cell wall biosynthesis
MSAPPRKVLMTADAVGGVWNYSLQLVSELGRRDIEVTLVVMGGKPSPDQAKEAACLRNLSLIGTDFRLEWMDEPEADLRLAGELLLELEAEQRPDVIHLNGYCHAALPFTAPVMVVAHSCVPTWWQACRGEPLPAEWSAYRARVAAGVAAADLIVAPTAAYLREFTAVHGQPRAMRVILNGRDPAAFAVASKRSVVLAAGRLWDEAKNIATLCKAADGLRWPVLIAGEATAPHGGTAEVPGNVHRVGRLGSPEIAARMAEAAVFAAPARYEPFGLAILEAALSGCALVLGDIPTLRELWDDSALFVPPDDDGALRSALVGLLFEPERSAAFGKRARRRAGRYTAAAMGEAYVDAYRGLVARAAGGVPAGEAFRALA